jgi:Fic family protein
MGTLLACTIVLIRHYNGSSRHVKHEEQAVLRLTSDQIKAVLKHGGHYSGHEWDEHEVKGYYTALAQVEQWVSQAIALSEKTIQTLHALVMAGGRSRVKPSPYRDGQNVIRDGKTRSIVYMPPEASDVPGLMQGMIQWINQTHELPCPLRAGIAHYQFATIHPYYDGNGRTVRLLTTLILHLGGYDLKGIYSLEEYYAHNLSAYYEALSLGPSHNYYLGRAGAAITPWIEYFLEGMAHSCQKVVQHMTSAAHSGLLDQAHHIRMLDPKKRKALELFQEYAIVTAHQIGALFGFKPRTSAHLCKRWVDDGFIEIVDFSNKGRKYRLAQQYENLVARVGFEPTKA